MIQNFFRGAGLAGALVFAARAGACAGDFAPVRLSSAEVLSAGTYWHVNNRIHLFWDRRPDRRSAVTLSWDARVAVTAVEAFVVAAGPAGRVRARLFGDGERSVATKLNPRHLGRWRRKSVGDATIRLARYEALASDAGPLVVWASPPFTEESLGIEVASRRIISDRRFAKALAHLLRRTLWPAPTAAEVDQLIAAVRVGLGASTEPATHPPTGR